MAVLPGTTREAAQALVARVMSLLKNETLQIGDQAVRLEVAIGVASFPDDGHDARTLFAAADADLYSKKPSRPAGA